MDAHQASLPLAGVPARTRVRSRLLLAVFAGGAAGAVARAALEQAWPASGHGWPWVTFAVNVTGTALLAYFITRLQERLPPSAYPRPLLGTGLCGALPPSTRSVRPARPEASGSPGSTTDFTPSSSALASPGKIGEAHAR